jgi:hypothetical protein
MVYLWTWHRCFYDVLGSYADLGVCTVRWVWFLVLQRLVRNRQTRMLVCCVLKNDNARTTWQSSSVRSLKPEEAVDVSRRESEQHLLNPKRQCKIASEYEAWIPLWPQKTVIYLRGAYGIPRDLGVRWALQLVVSPTTKRIDRSGEPQMI